MCCAAIHVYCLKYDGFCYMYFILFLLATLGYMPLVFVINATFKNLFLVQFAIRGYNAVNQICPALILEYFDLNQSVYLICVVYIARVIKLIFITRVMLIKHFRSMLLLKKSLASKLQ